MNDVKDRYKNIKKNAHWKVYFNNRLRIKRDIGMLTFYLLPTIEYFDDNNEHISDYSFNISFNWLLWGITISRYWGNVYDKFR